MNSFTHNNMTKLLNVQGLIIYKIYNFEECTELKVSFPGKVKCCPYCSSKKFNKHGFGRERKIKHGISINGLPIYFKFKPRRFKCKKCDRTWNKEYPKKLLIPQKRQSIACEKQTLRKLRTSSFKDTGEEMLMSYSKVRKILEEYISDNILLNYPKTKDLFLGIDEHSRSKKKFAITITLLGPEKKVLTVLPNKRIKDLINWFEKYWSLEDRLRVKEVCVDMAKCWPLSIKKLFPEAKIVLDHFHIVKYLNAEIAKEFNLLNINNKKKYTFGITKLLRQSGKHWSNTDKARMEKVLNEYPTVANLWYWKEEVRSIYRECRKENNKELAKIEARRRWQVVLKNVNKSLRKTFENKLEWILNYFDNLTTNAFTEGIHTKFKLIKRYSYGIKNEQVYLKKLFLGLLNKENLIINNSI